MKRFTVINKYINKYDYKTYLEIGVQKGKSFNKVECDTKTGVDPDYNSEAQFKVTSDEFFDVLCTCDSWKEANVKWDVFFLDGLHESPQLYKDINNSLRYLSEGGTIICHDCNPTDYGSQVVPRIQRHWNGDVWKDIVRLRTEREDLEIFTIDCDEGCTIIRKGKLPSKKLDITDCDLNYENLEKNRKYWLDIISVEQWLEMLDNE